MSGGSYVKCLNQNCDADEIEKDDNFCYKCGHWTAKGYTFAKDKNNLESILNGEVLKKESKFFFMIITALSAFIFFFLTSFLWGNNLYKSLFYLKRQLNSQVYGYNVSIIKTDNTYNGKLVNSYEQAIEMIKADLNLQSWKCMHRTQTLQYENEITTFTDIPIVSFCDASDEVAKKITDVVKDVYVLFPNIEGSLTNISITNAASNSEYIARFQPMFQFINAKENIENYNKVNKTQILLNSYYFLNEDIMKQPLSSVVNKDWYVKDATWESTIAHELGHYISFKAFLKKNGVDNITFITKENEEEISALVNQFDEGTFSSMVLNQALQNYNEKYNQTLDISSFALTISKYAGATDKNGLLIADETIAEAIHDYYLHKGNLEKSSLEIIQVIRKYL